MVGKIFLILLILLYCAFFGRAFYYLFDHIKWEEDSKPDPNAKIIGIYSEKVKYVKNGMKYKTTVTFSDGFNFITHKTKRQDHFFTYEISIDESLKDEIVSKAERLHAEAVERLCKEIPSQDVNCNEYSKTNREPRQESLSASYSTKKSVNNLLIPFLSKEISEDDNKHSDNSETKANDEKLNEESSKGNDVESWEFCPICGADITEDRSQCHVCSAPINK